MSSIKTSLLGCAIGLIPCMPCAMLLAVVGCDPDTSSSRSATNANTDATIDTPAADAGVAEKPKDGGADAKPPIGSDGGSVTITGGTFKELTLNAVDAVAFIDPGEASGPGIKTRLRIIAADRENLCTVGPVRQGATLFFIDALSGDEPFKPGTFTQMMDSVPGQVDTGMSKLSATCGPTVPGQDYGASEATVIVTQLTDALVSGTFDLTFPNNRGTLQGTFEVPICGQPFNSSCQP